MNRMMLFSLGLVFGLAAPAAAAQSADEVVARGLKALGGVDKLKSIQTRRSSGTVITQFNPLTGSDGQFEVLTSDYREVDGVMLPHSIESRSGGTTFNQLDLEKIEFNLDVDPQIFVRPPV